MAISQEEEISKILLGFKADFYVTIEKKLDIEKDGTLRYDIALNQRENDMQKILTEIIGNDKEGYSFAYHRALFMFRKMEKSGKKVLCSGMRIITEPLGLDKPTVYFTGSPHF